MRVGRRALAWPALALLLIATAGCAGKNKSKTQALPPEQVYQMAMQKLAHKHYYTARGLLQELLPRIPPDDRDLLPKVQLAIADAFFKDGGQLNYGEALNAYRTFLTYYPNHEEAARAQFMVGMSLFQQALSPDRDQALTLQAIDEFHKVETSFPASPFIEQATVKTRECNDRLAEHERVVARFYQKRRRYNAAIDRYRFILDKYPHYRATNEILLEIGTCLLAVGNRPEAEEFLGRLVQEDPDGRLAARAREALADYDKGRKDKEPKKG